MRFSILKEVEGLAFRTINFSLGTEAHLNS